MAPPTGAVPPPLAPTVEEAYRRKCIQLKQRINEVEHDNDSSRLRVVRLERGVQKLRLERAFLLEQLSKRTSTNVEDSEGSPSPPPTPKEKPLRTKRGHRKPSFLTNLGDVTAGSAFIQQGPVTLSPSSDAFSHTHHDTNTLRNSTPQAQPPKRLIPTNSNGTLSNSNSASSSAPNSRKVKNAFEIFIEESRPRLMIQFSEGIADGTFDLDAALSRGWRDLDENGKHIFQARADTAKKAAQAPAVPRPAVFDGEPRAGSSSRDVIAADEDVEMGDDVDAPTPAPEGGFTAVNRG